MSEAPQEGAETHADSGEEIHMPPNSWWPLVTAVGVALSLLGIIFLNPPVILVVGIIVTLGGVGMWVVDARKEYTELH
jgi:hypothetical protein